MESTLWYVPIVVLLPIVILLSFMLFRLTKSLAEKIASGILAIYVAESMLIRNLTPNSRPKFVLSRTDKQVEVADFYVPMWYTVFVRKAVERHLQEKGYEVASDMIKFILEDLESDPKLTIKR